MQDKVSFGPIIIIKSVYSLMQYYKKEMCFMIVQILKMTDIQSKIIISSFHLFQNMYQNFGDIGASIKTLVDEFQDKQKSHAKIESISDMKVRAVH